MVREESPANVMERAIDRNARLAMTARKLAHAYHRDQGHFAPRWIDCENPICRRAYQEIEGNTRDES